METAVARLPFAHERWNKEMGERDLARLEKATRKSRKSRLCVHIHLGSAEENGAAKALHASVRNQSFPPEAVLVTQEKGVGFSLEQGGIWEAIPETFDSRIAGLSTALIRARDLGLNWLVPLDASATLPRHGLAGYAGYACDDPESSNTALLYGDEVEAGLWLSNPRMWLKPQWDQRMILSQDYISGACALHVETALAMLEDESGERPESLFELILRLGLASGAKHVGRVTGVRPRDAWQGQGDETLAAVRRVMGEAFESVEAGPFGTVSSRFPLPHTAPSVSVIVATRDRVELLRACVHGVLHGTKYPNLDLIIADNESVEPETLDYMEQVSRDLRVQVVRWPHPFNYSAINNFAARHAKGDYLCLLNNDIEILDPDWLDSMVREAAQPGVGAVGARLLYPDRSIQHAGVAIGIGNAAGHAHRGLPPGEAGYFAQALIARGASAVTAACLVVAREHFEAVGGLDEEGLAVAYNDVDLCLKLRAMGLRNIFTPKATLIHHESKSRGLDFAPEHMERYLRELQVFQKRWGTNLVVDPWHHPRLDRARENYS